MNKKILLTMLAMSLIAVAGCQTGTENDITNDISNADITQKEEADITLLRQEETLAGDLYEEFYRTYDKRVFNNIARSENRHTNAVKTLIDSYGLKDPNMANGTYENPELQEAYNELREKGRKNYTEALKASAYLEEKDIQDLTKAINRTDKEEIQKVYTSLRRGSANHLRAFKKKLAQENIQYQNQLVQEKIVQTYR